MSFSRKALLMFAVGCCFLLSSPQIASSRVHFDAYSSPDAEISLPGSIMIGSRLKGRRSMLRASDVDVERTWQETGETSLAGPRRSLSQAPSVCTSAVATSTQLTLKFAACCPEAVGANAGDLSMDLSRLHIEYQLPGADWQSLKNVLNYPAIDGTRTFARIVGESAAFQKVFPQVPQCAAVRVYVDTANAATQEIWSNADFSQPVWETQYAVPDAFNTSTLVLPVCPPAWYTGCAVSSTNTECKMPGAYCPDPANVDETGNWIVAPSLNGSTPPPAPTSTPNPAGVAAPPVTVNTPAPAPSKGGSSSTGVAVGVGVACGAVALLALALLAVFLRRRARGRAAGAHEVSTSPGVSTSARAELLPDDADNHTFPKPKGDLGPLVNAEIPFSSNKGPVHFSQLLPGGSQYSSTVTVTGSGYGSGLQMESGEQPSDSDVLRAAESQLQDAQRTIGGHHLNSVVMTSAANGGHATISSGWNVDWHPDELYAQVQKMVFARQMFAGKYTMSGEVIVGGQGCVVFATVPKAASHTGEVMEVAIKFHFNLETFTNEAELVENEELEFHLPQVVEISRNVHDVQAPNGKTFPPFIVLPRGEPLDLFIKARRPDSLHCIMILIHLAEKLAAMHAAGLVHRDVKPANSIWLPVEHEWNLIDFGCAAPIGMECQLMFTPRYAPPEVVQAAMAQARTMVVEASVDVWALGVVAYQLLTGSTKLSDMKAEELFAALQGKLPLPWEQEDSHVSFNVAKDFAGIILRMLARDPSQRPSMQEVVDGWRRVTGIAV